MSDTVTDHMTERNNYAFLVARRLLIRLGRQLRRGNDYPNDPYKLTEYLEKAIDGTLNYHKELNFRPMVTVTVPAEKHSLHKFYKKRQGLWIADSDHELIVRSAKPVIVTGEAELGCGDLAKETSFEEIRHIIAGKFLFKDFSLMLGHIATMIELQKEGVGGILSDRVPNYFFAEVKDKIISVDLDWSPGEDYHHWSFGHSIINKEDSFRPGSRIFCSSMEWYKHNLST